LGIAVSFWPQVLQHPQVLAIHSDHIIKAFKVRLLNLAGSRIETDPVLPSYEGSTTVGSLPDMPRPCSCRVDEEVIVESLLLYEMPEDPFGQRGTTNVPKADKEHGCLRSSFRGRVHQVAGSVEAKGWIIMIRLVTWPTCSCVTPLTRKLVTFLSVGFLNKKAIGIQPLEQTARPQDWASIVSST